MPRPLRPSAAGAARLPRTVRAILAACAAIAAGATLASCASAAATVEVFHSLGSRQCEGGGDTAEALADRLRAAGVPVRAVACGTDGRLRPMVCGAGDGRIAIVEIPADRLAGAEAQGFRPLTALPEARRIPCPTPSR